MTISESNGDPDRLPDSSDPNGPCPRCGRVANFAVCFSGDITFRKDGTFAVGHDGLRQRLPIQRASILECSGCRDRIVVIEDRLQDARRESQSGMISWQGIHWWPIPGTVGFSEDVPERVIASFGEGIRCLSAGAPNGAVAMFRTAMTWIVLESGSEAAKAKADLRDRVKQMVADGGLTATLGDWVDHVRLYGNAGVHPDVYGDVSLEEASEVARLVATLTELIYVTPAKIARRRAERLP